MRRECREVRIGNVAIGGKNRIAVQSMTNTDTADRESTSAQLTLLAAAGCDIARMTVNGMGAVRNIPYYKTVTDMPLVADIHFDYRMAIESVAAGIDKIRINPGNIGDSSRVKAVADCCRRAGVPIRVGVNGGSLDNDILQKYGEPTGEALAEAGLRAAAMLERYDFDDIVISVKSSDPVRMIRAGEIIAARCDYPLHLGVTEAGGEQMGTVRNDIGIGSLLAHGIGDTVRVSLTADPVREIFAARRILRALGLEGGVNVVSCPTCGRTRIDLIPLVRRVEKLCEGIHTDKRITVAVMGCIVNGPGEAREADVGIAGGNGEALLFRHGEPVGKIREEDIEAVLTSEIKRIVNE